MCPAVLIAACMKAKGLVSTAEMRQRSSPRHLFRARQSTHCRICRALDLDLTWELERAPRSAAYSCPLGLLKGDPNDC